MPIHELLTGKVAHNYRFVDLPTDGDILVRDPYVPSEIPGTMLAPRLVIAIFQNYAIAQ